MEINMENKFYSFKQKSSNIKVIHFMFVLILAALEAYLVYKTGGTMHAYTNLMYIPIIMSVFVLGFKGGFFLSAFAGLILGPFMPEDVKLGVMQSPINWLTRIFIYLIVSYTLGLMVLHEKKLNKTIQDKAYENPVTGLPNINKLILDLKNIIEENTFEGFTMIGFVFENMQQINRYVDFDIGAKSFEFLLNRSAESFNGCQIYSIYRDEIIIILPGKSLRGTYEKSKSL
jgi:hypothetical protein